MNRIPKTRIKSCRIKVLHVLASSDIGGAEKVLLSLLDEIDRESFEQSVFVLGDSPLLGECQSRGISAYSIPVYRSDKDLRFLFRLCSAVKALRPNVIHGHIWQPSFYSVLCGSILRLPVVSTFHSNYNAVSAYERLSLWLVKMFCASIVMVSRQQVDHHDCKGVMGKVVVIPNGVSAARADSIDAPTRRRFKREELGLRVDDKVIISVANLRPVKGHSFLLAGFRLHHERSPSSRLVLVGHGPLATDLKEQCRVMGIHDCVCFLGSRSDVGDLLQMADLYVCSSLSEARSLAIMEAMSLGVPVIATEVGGNSELIADMVDGCLVPYGNAERLSEVMGSILGDDMLAVGLGSTARAKAEKYFSCRVMAKLYENLYYKTAREPAGRGNQNPTIA